MTAAELRRDLQNALGDDGTYALVRLGRDHRAVLYPVRRVVSDCTVGDSGKPVLVIETDDIGADHRLLELGWRPVLPQEEK